MTQEPVPIQALSQLEALPVEIQQKIFLHCLEVNLPRSSPHLARALSSPILYTWLIRLAFSSSNESSRSSFFTPEFLPPPLDFFALSVDERRELQRTILNCRWCTLELMRRCQREYIEHALRHQCQDLVFTPADAHTLRHIAHQFNDVQRYQQGTHGQIGKGDLIFRPRHRDTYTEYRVAIWLHSGAVQVRLPGSIHTDLDLFRLPSCAGRLPSCMPDKLLCPPWSDEKIEFLRLLATEVYVDDDEEHERSGRVLRQLIRGRDYRTFAILAELFIRVRVYRYPIRWPVLPMHFKAALKYAADDGTNDPILAFLVQKRWDDIPWHETKLKEALMARTASITIS